MTWETVIELEVHAQLATRTKLFCSCPNGGDAAPNSRVCPICLGHPGTLPRTNERAVELAARFGLACGAEIRPTSVFARKNYFYPDLPKGYQITQYQQPIAEHGAVKIRTPGGEKTIRVLRVHIEEDAGKTMHEHPYRDLPTDVSLVDFNRAGVPLIEIVSEPDLSSADEAHAYLLRLRQRLLYTGVSEANLEAGNFRCDANVSVRRPGAALGERVEIKNLNSFKFLRQALEHEVSRQIAVLEGGGRIVRQTRLWDTERSETRPMRSKEEEEDYRYFDDPDLPPIVLAAADIARLAAELPELPEAREQRFIASFGLSPAEAALLADDRARAERFEVEIVAALDPELPNRSEAIRAAAKLETGVVLELEKELDRLPQAGDVARLAGRIASGAITLGAAKTVLAEAARSGQDPDRLIESLSLSRIADSGQLEALVDQTLQAHPSQAGELRAGKAKLEGFFVGKVMAATKGAADAAKVTEILRRKIAGAG